MLDNSKSIRQEEGISIWKDNGFRGTLQYVMRFGKTRIAELVIKRTRANNVNSDKRIVILTPTDIASKNVAYICKGYDCESYTITSLNNAIIGGLDTKGYLLVIDEIHRFLSDKTLELIKKLDFQYKLGLTGSTLSVTDKTKLRGIGFPVIDIITEEEAIANNWIADYDEYNVPIEISEKDKVRYKSLNDNIRLISEDFRGIYKLVNAKFNKTVVTSDYEVMQACRSGLQLYEDKIRVIKGMFLKPDYVRLIVANVMGWEKDKVCTNEYEAKLQKFWHPDNIQELSKSYLKSVAARNNYLKHNVAKVNAVLSILRLTKESTIVYNDSIEMIDQLYDNLGSKFAVKYHSQVESMYMHYDNGEVITYLSGDKAGQPKLFGKTTIKRLAIERMKSNDALYLITGRSLNESLDIPNIKYIICTAGDTNPQTYEQRVARGKTINSNDATKRATIINLYIDDFYLGFELVNSRDKEKLIIRQANVKNTIWLENIDELFVLLKK